MAYEGLELLIRAFAESNARCSLTIYPAEGRDAAGELASSISTYRVAGRVELRDRVPRERLAATLAQYDVGTVLYPVRPGQNANAVLAAPNKLYEYLASGLAVIASNNETLQFISTERLGWNLASGDVDAVAEALLSAESRSEVDGCRKRAYEAFVQRYNYETEASSFIDWICSKAPVSRARI
jgi:glycosyltransferase involved in cell wall biosynthesis